MFNKPFNFTTVKNERDRSALSWKSRVLNDTNVATCDITIRVRQIEAGFDLFLINTLLNTLCWTHVNMFDANFAHQLLYTLQWTEKCSSFATWRSFKFNDPRLLACWLLKDWCRTACASVLSYLDKNLLRTFWYNSFLDHVIIWWLSLLWKHE